MIDPTDDETVLWRSCGKKLCKYHMMVKTEDNGAIEVEGQYCSEGECAISRQSKEGELERLKKKDARKCYRRCGSLFVICIIIAVIVSVTASPSEDDGCFDTSYTFSDGYTVGGSSCLDLETG
jgi:hypothetical protein